MNESKDQTSRSYWRANIRILIMLLSVWFLVGYVLSIFFVESLNKIHIGSVISFL